jgi:bla regulator protein BlaR1
MAVFVTYLYFPPQFSRQVADRPVLDKTGLEGFFDLTLDWTPDTAPPNSTATGPSIYTALEEQTGLKLEPRKAPFEFLFIDHVEKPAEN